METIDNALGRLSAALDRLDARLTARLSADAVRLAELETALAAARAGEAQTRQAAPRGRLDSVPVNTIDQLPLLLGE